MDGHTYIRSIHKNQAMFFKFNNRQKSSSISSCLRFADRYRVILLHHMNKHSETLIHDYEFHLFRFRQPPYRIDQSLFYISK